MMKKNDTALNMLLPNKLYDDAKKAADRRNISLAALVRMALTEWLEDEVTGESVADENINDIFNTLPGDSGKGG